MKLGFGLWASVFEKKPLKSQVQNPKPTLMKLSRAQKLLLIVELAPALLLAWLYLAQRARLGRAWPWYFGANAQNAKDKGELRVRFTRWTPNGAEFVSGRVQFGPNARYGDYSQMHLGQTVRQVWNARAHQVASGSALTWAPHFAATPDGSLRVEHFNGRNFVLRDAESLRVLQSFTASEPVGAVAISPRGDLVASGGALRTEVWDARGQRRFTLRAGSVTALRFSPDGNFLGVATGYGPMHIFNARNGQEQPARGAPDGSGVRTFDFSPDGRSLALCGGNGFAYRVAWRGKTPPVSLQGAGEAFTVAFSPDGQKLAVGRNGAVQLWNAQTGKLRRTLKSSTAFEPDNSSEPSTNAANNAASNTANAADAAGNVVYGAMNAVSAPNDDNADGDNSSVSALSWSPDSDTLAAQTQRGVLLWNTR